MKVVVLGTRGFPDVQGGVEAHCENLYPRVVAEGIEVVVLGRKPYVGAKVYSYKGVKIAPISCPRNKYFEAFIHTLFGVFKAKMIGCDILHIHAIGPSILVPLAKLIGHKVVVTNHGPDYDRKKWSGTAKKILKFGERSGAKYADKVISISPVIAEHIKKAYRKDSVIIPNGVDLPEVPETTVALDKYGIEKNKYILAVGRFVPEKGFHDLIEAYKATRHKNCELRTTNYKLVIAGDADHPDAYSDSLKEKAQECDDVILTGYITGLPLKELYANAGLFVLPSYHEGLPIVLLEAMSYGLSCIASDIPANKNIDLDDDRFFPPGNIGTISEKIERYLSSEITDKEKEIQIDMIRNKYNWDVVARETIEVYESVVRSS
jgi:glycosyltransferase involved in cell wall biosynthesis